MASANTNNPLRNIPKQVILLSFFVQYKIIAMSEQALNDINQDDEISLGEIIDFLAGEWRALLLAATTVMVLVTGGAFLFGDYKVSGLIINSNPSNPSSGAFDFVKWKYFQKALPDLASELVQSGRVKSDAEDMFKRMSRAEWWDKNVVPVFALSKNDSKLLGSISKELLDSSGTLIQYLVVDCSGSTKDDAEKNLETSIEFIRSGSAYLALKGLVSGIDTETARAEAELRRQILAAELEMTFLEEKSRNLELLRKRFNGNSAGAGAVGQVLDPKDAVAKYLPLDTQLVAVNADIYGLRESLVRHRNTQMQNLVIRNFLAKAVPALAQITVGPDLGNELLRIVSELRKDLDAEDLVRQQALTGLESNIGSILTSFGKGLQTSVAPQARRASKFALMGALGFIGGGLAMLLFVLARRAYVRSGTVKP